MPIVWGVAVAAADQLARRRGLGAFTVPGCKVVDNPSAAQVAAGVVPKTIPCAPATMRAAVERQLHAAGLLEQGRALSSEVYSLARNVASEAGGGSFGERVAMAEAGVNRARLEGVSIDRLMMRDGKLYGRQSGSNPRVASSKDPTWVDLVIADLAITGQTGAYTRGATHYFSPDAQDSLFRTGRVPDDRSRIYERWTKTYGLMWVGPIPGIDPSEQFLMVDVGTSHPLFSQQYRAGLAALRGDDPGAALCVDPPAGGAVVAVIGGLALVAGVGFAVLWGRS